MKNPSTTQEVGKGATVKILSPQDLAKRLNEVHEVIAQRAYELFVGRGGTHGRDLEDWLEAESDIVHVCWHDLRETKQSLVWRADLPGSFRADQLQVSVEPKHLIVSGEAELDVLCGGHWTAHVEKKTRRILETHDLPALVDPSKATATLTGETLEIVMPKAAADGKFKEKAEAAAAGR